jgi:hypothetical protein
VDKELTPQKFQPPKPRQRAKRWTLDAGLAEKAIGRARHMSVSFQAGIFPFKDEHGRPSRFPNFDGKESR